MRSAIDPRERWSPFFLFRICTHHLALQIDLTVQRAKEEGDLPVQGFNDPASFIAGIKKPRRVVLLVMAGKPVDDTIELLSQHMEEVSWTVKSEGLTSELLL